MSKYPNSGTLGKNTRQREGMKDPGYSGQCEIAGVAYWIAAWVKDGKDGSKFFSLSFKPKGEPKQSPSAPAAAPDKNQIDGNDNVPF